MTVAVLPRQASTKKDPFLSLSLSLFFVSDVKMQRRKNRDTRGEEEKRERWRPICFSPRLAYRWARLSEFGSWTRPTFLLLTGDKQKQKIQLIQMHRATIDTIHCDIVLFLLLSSFSFLHTSKVTWLVLTSIYSQIVLFSPLSELVSSFSFFRWLPTRRDFPFRSIGSTSVFSADRSVNSAPLPYGSNERHQQWNNQTRLSLLALFPPYPPPLEINCNTQLNLVVDDIFYFYKEN